MDTEGEDDDADYTKQVSNAVDRANKKIEEEKIQKIENIWLVDDPEINPIFKHPYMNQKYPQYTLMMHTYENMKHESMYMNNPRMRYSLFR